MQKTNIDGIDLNLLPPLHALLIERHVSRAANRAGMSQPAMSRALARLRHLAGDPLLRRAGGGYALTPRAETLLAQLTPLIGQLAHLFAPPLFDPKTIERTVRIAASDTHMLNFSPGLMQIIQHEAPGVRLVFEPYRRDLFSCMERGEMDFAFALAATPLPPSARSLVLGDDALALVMARDHPLAEKALTAALYATQSHVTIGIMGDGLSDIDAALSALGLTRRIGLTTPSFLVSLAVVAQTTMITTLSQQFARRFGDPERLVIRDLPFPMPPLRIVLAWSVVKDADPLLIWLRGHMAAIAADIYGPPVHAAET